MLGSVPDDDLIIVADLEAGIDTLTRLAEQSIDLTVVVVEPTPRSIDVAERAIGVAEERGQGRLALVANKVADDQDLARIAAAFAGRELIVVPDDPDVDRADRDGCSPLDRESTAVRALRPLVDVVLEHL